LNGTKVVTDKALSLKDLIVRNETNKLVSDLVNVEKVSSMLKMVSRRRRYLAEREQNRAAAQGDWMKHFREVVTFNTSNFLGIPAITFDIESIPSTPISVDIASSQRDSNGTPVGSPTPSPRNSRQFSPEMSLSLDTGASTLQRSRRISDISMLSADLASRISYVSCHFL
jgi:voltage-dependent calcium channel